MVKDLEGTVAEITAVCEAEGIDADIVPSEEMMVATNPAQMQRMKEDVAHHRHWGNAHRVRELTPQEVAQRISIPGVMGAMVVSGMARIQPAKLVRGLAEAVERKGAVIVEGTQVISYHKGRVVTNRGVVKAPIILRCTEGFTAGIEGHKREWVPLNSAQIATVPLPPEVWAKIGWDGRELIGDMKNAYCYCQRTREGRITVGARGVPYKFGSRMDANGAPDAETIARLTAILHEHFPEAAKYPIDHAWCGVIGVPRDWCATVGLDRETGLGRRLCRHGGFDGQPCGPHAGRSGPWPRHADYPPPLGQPPRAAMGTRALPLAGHSHDVHAVRHRRPAGKAPSGQTLAPCGLWQLDHRPPLGRRILSQKSSGPRKARACLSYSASSSASARRASASRAASIRALRRRFSS